VNRRILLACCTFATAMGSIVVAAPASADGCPWGTVARFDGVCTQGQSGGAPPPGITVPPQGADVVSLPGQLSFVTSIAPIALAMGVPIAPLAILIAVETIPDIFRTVGNVTMDVAVTGAVARPTPEG